MRIINISPGDPRWLAIVAAMANTMEEHGQDCNVLEALDTPHLKLRIPLGDGSMWAWELAANDLNSDAREVARIAYAQYRTARESV
jgi:hypothetical protein